MAHVENLRFSAEYLQYQYGNSEKLRIRIETHERYSEGTETFTDDVVRHLELYPQMAVLDIGCGSGEWWPRLPEVRAIVGVDLMKGMLQEAGAEHSTLHPHPQLVQADASKLPFPDASFDRVLCSGVLYHLRDCRPALSEMRRLLRPGGRAVITTVGADTMRRLLDIHGQAAKDLGFEVMPAPRIFNMNDTPLVEAVFASVERHVLEGALVFPSVEPALRFHATNRVDYIGPYPLDGSHREPLLVAMKEKIEALIRAEGEFRVPKSVGWFVATA